VTTPAVAVRPYAADDEERLLAIMRAAEPDNPPPMPGYIAHMLDALSEEQVAIDVAEAGAAVAGFALTTRYFDAADPGAYTLQIVVEPEQRGHGAGRALYDRASAILHDWRAERIYTSVRDDGGPGQGFAERRGFESTGRITRSSRLSTSTANLEKTQAAAARVAAQGIRIVTLRDMESDRIQDVYRAMNEATKDMPSSEQSTDLPFGLWRAAFLDSPGGGAERFWVALDGETVVGVAPLTLLGGGAATNAFTGVVRSHRGRGIARALKLATIEWARANGVDYIYTGNDSDNAPMLAVNRDLGYEQLPPSIEMVKKT